MSSHFEDYNCTVMKTKIAFDFVTRRSRNIDKQMVACLFDPVLEQGMAHISCSMPDAGRVT